VRKLKDTLPKNTLFYFDPPYLVKGKELYVNHYNYDNHVEIATEIFKINGQKWIVTYDKVLPIKKLYQNYNPITYSLRYSAGNYNKGKEIIIASKGTLMPYLI